MKIKIFTLALSMAPVRKMNSTLHNLRYLKYGIVALFIVIYTSCTVQKRVYQKGYYISWKKDKARTNLTVTSGEKKDYLTAVNKSKDISSLRNFLAQDDKSVNVAGKMAQQHLAAATTYTDTDTCDVLLYKDGSKIRVKLLEISANEIKYKRCDNLSGPTYVSSKSELYMIKYSNGQDELVRVEEAPRKQPAPTSNYNTYKKKDTGRYGGGRVTHPFAPFVLILGILSLVLGYAWLLLTLEGVLFGFNLLIVVLLTAIAAFVLGNRTLRDIREDPEHYKGKGLAMPGYIFSLVVLGIAATIGLIYLLSR